MFFQALQPKLFRFKFHSLGSKILKIPEFNLSIALYSESVARSISFSISIPKLCSNVGSERLHLSQEVVINNSMSPGIHDLVFWKDSILKSIDGKVSRSNSLSVSENKRLIMCSISYRLYDILLYTLSITILFCITWSLWEASS